MKNRSIFDQILINFLIEKLVDFWPIFGQKLGQKSANFWRDVASSATQGAGETTALSIIPTVSS